MNSASPIRSVLVTGGGGYVGAVLVPQLLEKGYEVRVLDLFLYGKEVLDSVARHPRLRVIQGDIRNEQTLRESLSGTDAVIHLACISNDPSFELNPDLGKSINYDAFLGLVKISKEVGVRRFVYASSSSVYGVKATPNVHEDLPLEPLTDYSKFKAMCEDVLLQARGPGFVTLIIRPATVCGYSPRQRLDLTVNILTNHAFNRGKITVFGGDQMRPNIHIEDMCRLYLKSLEWRDDQIDGKIYNVGYENHTVSQIAEMVREIVGNGTTIETTPTEDNRSYHVSSEKIRRELGFVPTHTIQDAIQDLTKAFKSGQLPESMKDSKYYNIKTMQKVGLT